jgi:hypothetical protein
MSVNYEAYCCVIFSNPLFSNSLDKCSFLRARNQVSPPCIKQTNLQLYRIYSLCQVEVLNLTGVAVITISSALVHHKRMLDLTFQSTRPYSF